jgi:hypothetical protein
MSQPAMSSVISAWAPKSERARIVGFAYSGIIQYDIHIVYEILLCTIKTMKVNRLSDIFQWNSVTMICITGCATLPIIIQ